jgi:hypothetical protein
MVNKTQRRSTEDQRRSPLAAPARGKAHGQQATGPKFTQRAGSLAAMVNVKTDGALGLTMRPALLVHDEVTE